MICEQTETLNDIQYGCMDCVIVFAEIPLYTRK